MNDDATRGVQPYGMEVVIDLRECDPTTFTGEVINTFFVKLCDLIEMKIYKTYFWDEADQTDLNSDLSGISAVCFIMTSSIVIHTVNLQRKLFLNVFSCKMFDASIPAQLAAETFGAKVALMTSIHRGK